MTTKICLLLDEDVYVTLAQALRKRGFDAVHVQELNRKGFSDREQLELAVKQERCLMSFNVCFCEMAFTATTLRCPSA
jgi:predicted nuclease of predicted toxin-antitoxin system